MLYGIQLNNKPDVGMENKFNESIKVYRPQIDLLAHPLLGE